MAKKELSPRLKFLTDFGPILVFFICYKFYGLYVATASIIALSAIAIIFTYIIAKHIPMMPLISALLVGVFGGLTLFSHNEVFIKMKPTIVNLLFALILFSGLIFKKGLIKYLLESSIKMNDQAWKSFSLRWALFFLLMGGLNEYIWRNFSTDIWVNFKVFGILGITFLFTLSQFPFLKQHMEDQDPKGDNGK